ncbi:hypothetical protein NDU88_007428 [Pleurodeles waltl]|uniref:Uncharacterized protein n=1 Tax=Pleurodeles waltl TaxID=8319 RepID=A0AAV7QRM0_PLEWA|nr:hypothetical protein NDU88_007428 [Pleurodeles waltl]
METVAGAARGAVWALVGCLTNESAEYRSHMKDCATRPVVARLLRYHDWDPLFNRAREADPFVVENGKVNMFPDFTAAVQGKRTSYMEVKKALHTEGI